MTGIIWNFIFFIIALGILVAVHEFGHFWVARRCGVKVHKFSIGFGKSLWRKIGKDGVEYSISMIPLGGFVKMLDSRVEEVDDGERHLAFNHKNLWQRSAIVAAGPAFNFVFAIFAYWLVFMLGTPSIKPVIGEVIPNSIAAQAGLETNMMVTQVDGVETPEWESVHMALVSHIGEREIRLTVIDDNEVGTSQQIVLDTTAWKFDPENDSVMTTLGFVPYRPEVNMTISQISEGSAAQKAGLKVGDLIRKVNQTSIDDWQSFVEYIQASPSEIIEVEVIRDQQLLTFDLVPEAKIINDKTVGFVGIAPTAGKWPEGYLFDYHYGFFAAIPKAVDKTWQIMSLTITMIKKLFTGDIGLNNLSGPITIAQGAGATADYGLVYFLGFLALISVNLGIINLLPLPVLDGGHLLFFAFEAVMRRPVPEKIQELAYRVGSMMIFALMLFAIYNDVARL